MRARETLMTSLLAILLAAPAVSAAPPSRNPAAVRNVDSHDPLRKPLLDALRPTVETDLGQKIIFVVDILRVEGSWAFAEVRPRTPMGRPIDFRQTRHAERQREGMLDGDTIYALLQRQGKTWRVRDYAIGPTDVAWDGWPGQYGAPRSLFALPDE